MAGEWSDAETTLHVSVLGMRAALLAITGFQECFMGNNIVLISDSMTLVAYLNKQEGTVSLSLCLLAQHVLLWVELLSLVLVERYIPGEGTSWCSG